MNVLPTTLSLQQSNEFLNTYMVKEQMLLNVGLKETGSCFSMWIHLFIWLHIFCLSTGFLDFGCGSSLYWLNHVVVWCSLMIIIMWSCFVWFWFMAFK